MRSEMLIARERLNKGCRPKETTQLRYSPRPDYKEEQANRRLFGGPILVPPNTLPGVDMLR